jgi:hypothetical protein
MRAAIGVLVAVGCGGDAPPTVDVGPTGPPSIAFASPSGEEPICVSIGDNPTASIPLLVSVEELVLNPPGTCGSYAQCGHLVLYANGVENNRSAVLGIDLLLHKLADPIHDGTLHAGTGEPDLLRLRVEVTHEAGHVLRDHAGEPLKAELALITVPDCALTDDQPN